MNRGVSRLGHLQQAILAGVALLVSQAGIAALTPSTECVSSRGERKDTSEATCLGTVYDGRKRTARVYLAGTAAAIDRDAGVSPPPARLDSGSAAASLLFVLHGGGGSGSGMESLTAGVFNRLADRDGAIVVYPDGVDRHWNDGRDLPEATARENVDDVGFILALVEELAGAHPLDRARIFATGISNGGFMSFRLACDAAATFAAVAPVTANLSEELGPRCKPVRPVAVAIFNGVEDPLVPWSGGTVGVLGKSRGAVWSAEKTFERWLELDACGERRTDARVDQNTEDKTAYVIHRGSDCRGGVQVLLYEIQGGGHTWPMGVKYAREWLVGRVSQELNATEEIWRFMNANARSNAKEETR